MMTTVLTGVRLNVTEPNEVLFAIELPDGSYYRSPDNEQAWPHYVATSIARNVSMKRHCTTIIRKVMIEEVTSRDSVFDRIVNYVDTLKGKALTLELSNHGLIKGSDPVASKRERLISHLTKCKDH